MQRIVTFFFAVLVALTLASCGAKVPDTGDLAQKKQQLEKLKAQQKDLGDQIRRLEEELARVDTSFARAQHAKLVALSTLSAGPFAHYIELQGRIDAQNVAYVTPRGGPGQVKAVLVKQGDVVRKGQTLLKLDDGLVRRQLDQLQTQLAYAKDLYQRQQNLWNQQIGTEVQLISARNNVTQIEKQIALAQEQLSFTDVKAEIDGVANTVNVRVGEIFTGGPQIQLVNTTDLKVVTQVPENYLERVKVGSALQVRIPEANNKVISTRVTVAGRLIDPNSRSFYIEAKIPQDRDLRPNQLALVGIRDYQADSVITIPVNTLQNDEKGKYVLVAEKEMDRLVARKRAVTIGELSGDRLEVKSGLRPGDQLIADGFQGLYDGQAITTSVN
ncbi:MAG TPA: efflux RND transporter periplasmic adaptor subunit [Chitinophagaceae bacterium]|nr:efflux RND transporter periplasmic adaptor subunit [Chitinophagaceae bacterium]